MTNIIAFVLGIIGAWAIIMGLWYFVQESIELFKENHKNKKQAQEKNKEKDKE